MKIKYVDYTTENACSWCGNVFGFLHIVSIENIETRTLCDNCLNNLIDFLKKIGIEVKEVRDC
jgi:hypothetical protein